MVRLYLRTLGLLGVRLVRGAGYKGPAAGAVSLLVGSVVVSLDLLLAAWIRGTMPEGLDPGSNTRTLLGASVVVALFFLAGPALLLTESIWQGGSRLRAALSTLPLTLREIALVTRLPGIFMALALAVLLLIPGAGAFLGLGLSPGSAVASAAASVLTGLAYAAFVVAGCHLLFRGPQSSNVRYSVALTIWLVLCAVESWQAGVALQAHRAPFAAYLQVLPSLARHVGEHGVLPPGAWVAIIPVSLVAVATLLWTGRVGSVARQRSVRWIWRSRWPLPLTTAELTRLLRSTSVLNNAVGVTVAAAGMSLILVRLPSQMRPALSEVLLAAVLSTVALPLVLVRGQTRPPVPAPLFLGLGPARWARAQIGASAILFAVMAAAPVTVLTVLDTPIWTILTVGVPYGVLAFGLAVAVGWMMPASPDNPLGQIVDSVGVLAIMATVAVLFGQALPVGSAGWIVATVLTGLLTATVPIVVESGRWARRTTRWSGSVSKA